MLMVDAETVAPSFQICCTDPDVVKDGVRHRDINDTPHGGRPVLISMQVQKGRCRNCGRRGLSEILPHVRPDRWMTDRLYVFIAREGLKQSNTHSEVARIAYVSEGTARAIIHEYINAKVALVQRETPRVLGIDEKKLLGDFRAVIGNIEERTVLNVLPDRREALRAYLEDLPDRHKVEVICIDQYRAYLTMAQDIFKGVPVVTDKFHVIRRANEAMDAVRIRVAKGIRSEHVGRAVRLKMSKTLFWTRSNDLEGEARATVREWWNRYPELAHAYWTKERFFEIYNCQTRVEAERDYATWRRALPDPIAKEFKAKLTIGRDWYEHVFNYFDHRYTTAYVESVNRMLDTMQAAGRGYSFPIIRGKLMLSSPLEKRTFRDRHPGKSVQYIGEAPPLPSTAWGVDIDKATRAMQSSFESFRQVEGGRYVSTGRQSGLATIEMDLAGLT
ncbi:ISL3 family transposase [Methylopila jiangsuensis]|uniref:ISL3 family transposase n=2 Tax=Methylopila jiangsuensis TaxID=586230 RepID=A0A9W6N5B3_9HYPH|nr:transposase [Methylopila jiangsuensis]GLK78071.1 ISL3 family transposase [Methylopila jiangsuensis]